MLWREQLIALFLKEMMNNEILFEFCNRGDERYQAIRDKHYVKNKGSHGQQIHFLIHYKGQIIGIISGGSSVYAVRARDDFFKIPKNKEIKQKYYLSAIINNTVFRLEYHEKNLGTRILSKWRKVIAKLWKELYGVPVIGFETFVVAKEGDGTLEDPVRNGRMYKADNWTYVGITAGNTKKHGKGGLTGHFQRETTDKKLIFCKREIFDQPKVAYVSSWRAETEEEKIRAKNISRVRNGLNGRMF